MSQFTKTELDAFEAQKQRNYQTYGAIESYGKKTTPATSQQLEQLSRVLGRPLFPEELPIQGFPQQGKRGPSFISPEQHAYFGNIATGNVSNTPPNTTLTNVPVQNPVMKAFSGHVGLNQGESQYSPYSEQALRQAPVVNGNTGNTPAPSMWSRFVNAFNTPAPYTPRGNDNLYTER